MVRLTQQQLETHLWGSAKILRGRTAWQDHKTYILSLMLTEKLRVPTADQAAEPSWTLFDSEVTA
jgi:type I restriction enzyme M protein